MKICSNCNEEKALDEFRLVKGKYYRSVCKRCENISDKSSQDLTREYINSLKLECCICGYNRCKKALEFHHTSDDKEIGIAQLQRRRWTPKAKETIDNEVSKCITVCANCHREIHEGLIQLM